MEKGKDLIGISFIIQVLQTGEKKEVIVWVSIRILADVAALIIKQIKEEGHIKPNL